MALPGKSTLRQSLLALVMLAILLASTGGAWLLVLHGQRRLTSGQNLLAQIHAQKLSHFYGDKALVQWFLGSKGGHIIGWRANVRSKNDALYQGLSVIAMGATPPQIQSRVVEKWSLDDDALAGQYESHFQDPTVSSAGATIQLEAGRLSMVQLFPHAVGQASGAAPANYLPEGTMAAALRLIAQQKADAIFSSIFDDHPNMGKVIDFVSVRFRYAGAVKQGDTSLDAVLVSAIGTKTTYWLNSQGEVVRSEDDEGVIWTAVTEKQVGEQFPEAPLQIWQLSESVLPQVQGFWKRLLGISL